MEGQAPSDVLHQVQPIDTLARSSNGELQGESYFESRAEEVWVVEVGRLQLVCEEERKALAIGPEFPIMCGPQTIS